MAFKTAAQRNEALQRIKQSGIWNGEKVNPDLVDLITHANEMHTTLTAVAADGAFGSLAAGVQSAVTASLA